MQSAHVGMWSERKPRSSPCRISSDLETKKEGKRQWRLQCAEKAGVEKARWPRSLQRNWPGWANMFSWSIRMNPIMGWAGRWAWDCPKILPRISGARKRRWKIWCCLILHTSFLRRHGHWVMCRKDIMRKKTGWSWWPAGRSMRWMRGAPVPWAISSASSSIIWCWGRMSMRWWIWKPVSSILAGGLTTGWIWSWWS